MHTFKIEVQVVAGQVSYQKTLRAKTKCLCMQRVIDMLHYWLEVKSTQCAKDPFVIDGDSMRLITSALKSIAGGTLTSKSAVYVVVPCYGRHRRMYFSLWIICAKMWWISTSTSKLPATRYSICRMILLITSFHLSNTHLPAQLDIIVDPTSTVTQEEFNEHTLLLAYHNRHGQPPSTHPLLFGPSSLLTWELRVVCAVEGLSCHQVYSAQ